MEHLAGFVNHVEAKLVLAGGNDGEAGFRAAEAGAFDGVDFATERGGGVDYIVYPAVRHADVLEVVDVSAEVHVYVVATEHRVEAFLQVEAFAV